VFDESLYPYVDEISLLAVHIDAEVYEPFVSHGVDVVVVLDVRTIGPTFYP
jgi:hypothetical protein